MSGSSDVFDILLKAEFLENEGTVSDPGGQVRVAIATQTEGDVEHTSIKAAPISAPAGEVPLVKGDISPSDSQGTLPTVFHLSSPASSTDGHD